MILNKNKRVYLVLSCLDLLTGIGNLGKRGLKMCDERLIPLVELSSQGDDFHSDLQNKIRDVTAELYCDEKDKPCLADSRRRPSTSPHSCVQREGKSADIDKDFQNILSRTQRSPSLQRLRGNS